MAVAAVTLNSNLLGPIELRSDTVITFPSGLPGFASLRHFALVETEREDLVWLQSVDDADVTFLLADPFTTVPGFEVDIPRALFGRLLAACPVAQGAPKVDARTPIGSPAQ